MRFLGVQGVGFRVDLRREHGGPETHSTMLETQSNQLYNDSHYTELRTASMCQYPERGLRV